MTIEEITALVTGSYDSKRCKEYWKAYNNLFKVNNTFCNCNCLRWYNRLREKLKI
jgi:hypothetical protein